MYTNEIISQLQWLLGLNTALIIAFFIGRWLVHEEGYKGSMQGKKGRVLWPFILSSYAIGLQFYILTFLTEDLKLFTIVGVINTILITYSIGTLYACLYIKTGYTMRLKRFARWFYKVKR